MPIVLSQALIEEKNKTESLEAWLVLVELISPDNLTEIYICRNTEDVTVNGQLYQAFPFELDDIVDTSKGSLPTFALKVSNIDRVIQQHIEEDATFGSGWAVNVKVVSTVDLDGAPEIELNAVLLNVSCDKVFATFECGIANPMMQQFPRQRYSSGFCQRTFRDGAGCPYAGPDAECAKTLDACGEKFPDLTFPNGVSGDIDGEMGFTIETFLNISSGGILTEVWPYTTDSRVAEVEVGTKVRISLQAGGYWDTTVIAKPSTAPYLTDTWYFPIDIEGIPAGDPYYIFTRTALFSTYEVYSGIYGTPYLPYLAFPGIPSRAIYQ